MTDNTSAKLEILKTRNPFVTSSVGDPWEEQYPDIAEVNRSAFEGIRDMIAQKTATPSLPCAGLVFGETGSGKTHLVSRILRYGLGAECPFSIAYVQPIEDPDQTYRYLLREIIVNLCYSADKNTPRSQMDRIVEKLLAEIAVTEPLPEAVPEKFYPETGISDFRDRIKDVFRRGRMERNLVKRLFHVIIACAEMLVQPETPRPSSRPVEKNTTADSFSKIRNRFPEIPKIFLQVLVQYPVPEKRSAVTEWLKGGAIDESDAVRLGVSDRTGDAPALLEQQACHMLEALGVLMARYGHPLIICFDRLENYDTDTKIRSLGAMVEFLVDRTRAMLPLVFVRGAQWEEILSRKLNQHVVSRLATNEFMLRGCDPDQAFAIVRSRLASVNGPDENNLFFPFDEQALAGSFKGRLLSPRQVITLSSRMLREILYPEVLNSPSAVVAPSSLERLRQEFGRHLQDIREDFDRCPPDRGRLRLALELYLKHIPEDAGFRIEGLNIPEDRFVDLEGMVISGDVSRPVLFIVDVEASHLSVKASLKRGLDFMDTAPGGRVIYIRDSRCEIPPPPKWKATNETLQSFRAMGGHMIFLDKDQAARWYALTRMSYDIKSGDVTVERYREEHRAVSHEELVEFVRREVHTEKYSGFRQVGKVLCSLSGNLQ